MKEHVQVLTVAACHRPAPRRSLHKAGQLCPHSVIPEIQCPFLRTSSFLLSRVRRQKKFSPPVNCNTCLVIIYLNDAVVGPPTAMNVRSSGRSNKY